MGHLVFTYSHPAFPLPSFTISPTLFLPVSLPPPPNYLVKIPLCKLNSQEIVSYITQELDKGKKRFNPPPLHTILTWEIK